MSRREPEAYSTCKTQMLIRFRTAQQIVRVATHKNKTVNNKKIFKNPNSLVFARNTPRPRGGCSATFQQTPWWLRGGEGRFMELYELKYIHRKVFF